MNMATATKTIVTTWMSPAGSEISICRPCEKKLSGKWPKDDAGQEYCQVSHGDHAGHCEAECHES